MCTYIQESLTVECLFFEGCLLKPATLNPLFTTLERLGKGGSLKETLYFSRHYKPRDLPQPGGQTAACNGLLDIREWRVLNIQCWFFTMFLIICETHLEQKEEQGKHTCWLESQTDARSVQGSGWLDKEVYSTPGQICDAQIRMSTQKKDSIKIFWECWQAVLDSLAFATMTFRTWVSS